MPHLKAQAAAALDWVTLHPLFTAAGAIALIAILRLIVRRRRGPG